MQILIELDLKKAEDLLVDMLFFFLIDLYLTNQKNKLLLVFFSTEANYMTTSKARKEAL